MLAGARHIVACDRAGTIYRGPQGEHELDEGWFAEHTNPDGIRGSGERRSGGRRRLHRPHRARRGHGGRSRHDASRRRSSSPWPTRRPRSCRRRPARYVRVMATGRSDYPNQINNSCGFPGIFRGLFDVRARRVNDEMKLAAAHALANIVADSELSEEYITPSMFDSAWCRRWPPRWPTPPCAPEWPAASAGSRARAAVSSSRVPTERRAGSGTPLPGTRSFNRACGRLNRATAPTSAASTIGRRSVPGRGLQPQPAGVVAPVAERMRRSFVGSVRE